MTDCKQNEKTVREPIFHIVKRDGMPLWKGVLIRLIAIVLGLILCGVFVTAASDRSKGFFSVYASLFSGAFGTERRIWLLLQNTALLLGVSLALVVTFKMRFWNLGGNGQILMGCLACTMCMYYFGGKLPDGVVYLFMIAASVLAGAIWAVIPAIFKAFFKTNESLFTLMMNYIALYLVAFFISYWYPNGTGAMDPLPNANLPVVGNKYLLTIIVVAVLTAAIFAYLRFSKHGYELSVVGESENTARYIGVNVKKVIIRTTLLSGAICGIVGLLLSGSINHTVSVDMDANMGFTGIMSAWLAKFNPLVMIATSFLITFLSKGMSQVCTDFGFTNEALSDIIIGIVYFFIIGCEFFVSYKINFNAEFKAKTNRFFGKIKKVFNKKTTPEETKSDKKEEL